MPLGEARMPKHQKNIFGSIAMLWNTLMLAGVAIAGSGHTVVARRQAPSSFSHPARQRRLYGGAALHRSFRNAYLQRST